MQREQAPTTASRQIVLLGMLVLFTVTGAALLYTNEPEFILARFPAVSKFQYSLFDTVLYLSYLIFGLMSGLLSDRYGKRKVFVVTGALGASAFYWLMTTVLDYSLLLILRFTQGAFTVLVWQTLMTLVLDNSTSENRGKNMGIFGAFMATAMGAGPIVGGVLAERGVFLPYYGAALLSLTVFIVGSAGIAEPQHLESRPSVTQSLLLARRSPQVVIPCTVNFVDRLHMGFLLTALPLMLVQLLGLSESLRGMVLGLFATPFILLQYPVGRMSDRIGRRKLVIFGSVSYALVLGLVGVAGHLSLSALIVTLILLGIFSGFTAPPTMAWVGDSVSPVDSATGMGLFNLFGNIGMIVGPVVLGLALFYADFVTAFVLASVIELLSLLVILIGGRLFSTTNESETEIG